MRHPCRALALACALTLSPACAALHFTAPNPIAAAQTTDQRAYALIQSYGALIETAATVVRDPSVPIEVKRAIGRAEAQRADFGDRVQRLSPGTRCVRCSIAR